jgi:hypothetical protein
MPERTAPADIDQALRGWLLFRHKAEPHLWCAVVHGHVLPDFLLTGAWQHHSREAAALLIGSFRQACAIHGAALNGFYLFQAITRGPGRPAQRAAMAEHRERNEQRKAGDVSLRSPKAA